MKIKKLDSKIINLIAAGEVVERPSSVVKELMENSIDANSKKIKIEIQEYGTKNIIVTDDGEGINKEDLPLTIEQHSTSKIHTEKDLENILSLGFRGEALASIAEVCEQIIITSKTKETSQEYTFIKNSKEKITIKTNELTTDSGTIVKIQNLFANIPARKSFLKTPTTETLHIYETFINIALPFLNIHFEIKNEDKLIYKLPKVNSVFDRILDIQNKEIANNLIFVKTENTEYEIHIYLGNPSIAKKSGHLQKIYVNNRYIQDKTIQSTIHKAYQGFIHKDLKPSYIALIYTKKPNMVDINVHPRKLEAKFKSQNEIIKIIYNTIFQTLTNKTKDFIKNLSTSSTKENKKSYLNNTHLNNFQNNNKNTQSLKLSELDMLSNSKKNVYQSILFTQKILDDSSKSQNYLIEDITTEYKTNNLISETIKNYKSNDIIINNNQLDNIDPIQIFNTYIVYEEADSIVIIDQHAAAEKIMFEKLLKEYNVRNTKTLLIPKIIRLKTEIEKNLLMEKKQDLESIGVKIEEFSKNEIIIVEIPEQIENEIPVEELLLSILENKLNNEYETEINIYQSKNQISIFCYNLIATLSCHSSIRAGQKLQKKQMINIIQNLNNLKNPYSCPHGRPIMTKITKYEIEKIFKRKI